LIATGFFAAKEIREHRDGMTNLARTTQIQIADALAP
jgi:hypothetical protein